MVKVGWTKMFFEGYLWQNVFHTYSSDTFGLYDQKVLFESGRINEVLEYVDTYTVN